MKSSWWHSATLEQKLAQIDGGIECGMTAAQVAMVSGTTRNAVTVLAGRNNRPFPLTVAKHVAAGHKTRRGNPSSRAAYLRGDAVDFWQEPTRTNTAEVEEIRF